METYHTNTRVIFSLGLVLLLLIGFNYLHAWTTAPNSPPNSNVAAPINTSGVSQIKTGPLGTGSLDVTGLQSITHNRPRLSFTDLNERDFRIDVDFNEMRFQTDRDNSGTFGPFGPTAADGFQSLVLHSSSTSAGDYALFSNQVRAAEYCDRGGNNCFLASDVGGGGPGSLPTCTPGEVLVAQAGGGWACGANFEQCHRFSSSINGNAPIVSIVDGSIDVSHIAMIGNYNSGYGSYDQQLWSGYWNSDFHSWGYFTGRTDSYVTSHLISANTWANVKNRKPKTITMVGPNSATMTLKYDYGSCH